MVRAIIQEKDKTIEGEFFADMLYSQKYEDVLCSLDVALKVLLKIF